MLPLCTDVHVPLAVTEGLRLHGIDVLTAQGDGYAREDDAALLRRATDLSRVLVSQDQDLLRIASDNQGSGRDFAGVVYAPQNEISIGKFVTDLLLVCVAADLEYMRNRVEWLPF